MVQPLRCRFSSPIRTVASGKARFNSQTVAGDAQRTSARATSATPTRKNAIIKNMSTKKIGANCNYRKARSGVPKSMPAPAQQDFYSFTPRPEHGSKRASSKCRAAQVADSPCELASGAKGPAFESRRVHHFSIAQPPRPPIHAADLLLVHLIGRTKTQADTPSEDFVEGAQGCPSPPIRSSKRRQRIIPIFLDALPRDSVIHLHVNAVDILKAVPGFTEVIVN